MSDQGDEAADFRLFRYNPSLGAAILFTFLFALASAHHTWLLTVTRTWFFIAFAVGCWCELTRLLPSYRVSLTIIAVEFIGFVTVSFSFSFSFPAAS